MKLSTTLASAFAALALATVGAQAQEIDTYAAANSNPAGFGQGYNDGDLVLAFFAAGDNNTNGDVLFNLGSSSNFTGLAAGTYSVAGFNGSSTTGQPTPGFGSSDIAANLSVPSSNTYWAVFGANPASDGGNNQLWVTGVGSQAQLSSGSQGTVGVTISTIGSNGAGGVQADGSAFDNSGASTGLAGQSLLGSGRFSGFASSVQDASVSSTSNTLGLYSLLPGTGGAGSSTELGYFTLTDNSGSYDLTFTVTAIPEPSTYAAILGALTIGFVLVRRRFASAAFSALA